MILILLLALIVTNSCAASNQYKKDDNTVNKNSSGTSFVVYKPQSLSKPNNKVIDKIYFSMNHIDKSVTRILLKDLNDERWEVPELCEDHKNEYKVTPFKEFDDTLEPFTFTLLENGETLLKFFDSSLIYEDKYIEFDVILPINRVFGLGERISHFALPPGTYTIWNHENMSPFDDGSGGFNMYGSHPFYVTQTKDKTRFLAIFFKNSNAQDAIVSLRDGRRYQITHKTTGGVIDLFVFHPNTLEVVLGKYHILIGRPYLPAFWAMGVQQSRWGYRTEWDIKRVIRGFEYYEIPFDALTLDIDYMHDYEIFTVEEKRYPNILKVVEDMHAKNINLVLILDPGIKIRKGYDVYDNFIKGKACIRGIKHPPYSVGIVWPGMCVFPDFYHPNTANLWKQGLKDLYDKTKYDGLMLDMIDISNFANGDLSNADLTDIKTEPDGCVFDASNHPKDEFDNLPYYPGNINLEAKTLSVTAYHCARNDYEDRFLKQYNVHNLFCYDKSKITSKYFVELTNKRPFILPRSTVPGSGHYSSHWQGDNWATWSHMRLSISGLFSFQLFGIPHVGSDICGFGGSGDAELCARWYQVGAFYTFTRNHNIRTFLPQEPWWFFENEKEDDKSIVITAARNAIRQKYSLLRLYYTRMIQVHLNGGYVVGPMFFEFPEDDTAFKEMEESIMIGGSILVSLALKPKQYSIDQYFPNADWYELKTGKRVATYNEKSNAGTRKILEASFKRNHLHIKGGSIIPYQHTEDTKISRAVHLLDMPIDLIIALTTKPNAKTMGTVIVEDGITAGLKEKKEYKQYDIECSNKGMIEIIFNKATTNYKREFINEKIDKIRLYGIDVTKTFGRAMLTFTNGTDSTLDAVHDKSLNTIIVDVKRISMEDIRKIGIMENVRNPYDL